MILPSSTKDVHLMENYSAKDIVADKEKARKKQFYWNLFIGVLIVIGAVTMFLFLVFFLHHLFQYLEMSYIKVLQKKEFSPFSKNEGVVIVPSWNEPKSKKSVRRAPSAEQN